jgi:hypothetical protein
MAAKTQFTIILAPRLGESKRSKELRDSYARSHAARASHAKGVQTRRLRKQTESEQSHQLLQNDSGLQRTISIGAENHDGLVWPQPRSILGQGRCDPFESDKIRQLPDIVRHSLEHTLLTLWPKNSPGIDSVALNKQILQWRTMAVHSPLQFHTQVSTAVSLCYSMSTDPQTMKTLLTYRWKHQFEGLKIMRDTIRGLTGPPSNEIIDCMNRLAAQGGNIYPTGPARRYPESPMVSVLPLRLYGRFEPCQPHIPAMAFLVQQRGGLKDIPAAISYPIAL